jgi:hypothetical protein
MPSREIIQSRRAEARSHWYVPPMERRPAESSSVFDGMQAQNEHSPPTRSRSTTTTDPPASRPAAYAASPAAPAPITITS